MEEGAKRVYSTPAILLLRELLPIVLFAFKKVTAADAQIPLVNFAGITRLAFLDGRFVVLDATYYMKCDCVPCSSGPKSVDHIIQNGRKTKIGYSTFL